MSTEAVVSRHTDFLDKSIREALLRGIKGLRESLDEAEHRVRNVKDPREAVRRVLFNISSGHMAAMVSVQTALHDCEGLEVAQAMQSPVPMEPVK